MTASWQRNGLWTSIVILVGGGFAYFLLVGKPAPATQPPPVLAKPSVEVITVQPDGQSIAVETQGSIRPLREINVVSRVSGRVERVSSRFAEGGFFAAGEELLKSEDIDYQFAIARAESQVAAAQQRVAEEKGRTLQASREWRDLGSDQANELFLRKPQLASAEAALRAAEADLGAARLDFERTVVSVPFNGRISEKYVDLGQYITAGTLIAKVYDTDLVQVRLPITDRQVALLDLPLNYENGPVVPDAGAAVSLHARFANEVWHWQGRIVRTDASIDVDSRVVYAVAEVSRPFSREPGSSRPPLAPGLFVSATISGRELPNVSVLPRVALRSDGDVWLVSQRDEVTARTVDVLHSDSKTVWVQGLVQGERVIVHETGRVAPGVQVNAREVTGVTGVEN